MGNRTVGIVLLVLGIVILLFGVNSTDAPMDRISEAFTGRFTDATMLYLIIGAVLGIVGLVMVSRRSV